MASFGLALVQGAKNAQEVAAGQLNTMSSMANAAKNASQIEDYFGPEATSMRNVDKADLALKANKLQVFNQMAPGIFADPTKAGRLLEASSPTNGMWDVAPMASDPNKYVAREILTDEAGNQTMGRERMFDSKEALLSTVGNEFTQTPREAMAAAQGLFNKQMEHKEKRADKTHEGLVKYETEIKPNNQSLELRTRWNNAAARDVANIGGNWDFKTARVRNELPAEKFWETVENQVNTDMNARRDKDGIVYITQVDPSGKAVGEIPLSSAPIETQQKYYNHKRNVAQAAAQGTAQGAGPIVGGLQGMALSKRIDQELEAARTRDNIKIGGVNASNPDMAAQQAARAVVNKPVNQPSWWQKPDLGGQMMKQDWLTKPGNVDITGY